MSARRSTASPKSERGAALLSVLLLVAVMSAVAVAVVEEIQFATRRAINVEARDQARWYAQGAEELARTVVARSYLESRGVTTLNEPWARGVTRFPVDGGYIDGVVWDASNCFNLNSVVEPTGSGRYTVRLAGVGQFTRLADELGVNAIDAQNIVNALVDWIDGDSQPYGGSGAEDFTYAMGDAPRRVPNTLMADESELRALHTMTPQLYAQLRPYVCVRPDSAPAVLNVNTLSEAHAPLLAAVYGELMDIETARSVILTRPEEGYDTLEEFTTQELLETIAPDENVSGQLSVRAEYFTYESQVVVGEAYVAQSGLLRQDPDGFVSVVRRSYGALQ